MLERIVPEDQSWNNQVAIHIQRYRFAVPYVRGKRVLDAGCGIGYGSKLLADAGPIAVMGVDISRDALDIAERQFANERLDFVCDDCQSLARVQGPFDVIVSFEALEHFSDGEAFVSRVAQLLAPGGVFMVSTPNKEFSLRNNPYHLREYTPAEFRALLERSFNHVTLLGQHWTAAHAGVHLATTVLWTNPFMRLGRWLQRLRGTRVPHPLEGLVPTESDLVISDLYPEAAWTLLAICHNGHDVTARATDRFLAQESRQ